MPRALRAASCLGCLIFLATPLIKCVLYMVCCSVQSVPHHFLFLEYMISLFLSPALEQHQYIYWSLSRMASEKNHYAATHLSGPLFVIVGGMDQSGFTLMDMWLCDTTTKLWKRVLIVSYHTVLCVHYICVHVNS